MNPGNVRKSDVKLNVPVTSSATPTNRPSAPVLMTPGQMQMQRFPNLPQFMQPIVTAASNMPMSYAVTGQQMATYAPYQPASAFQPMQMVPVVYSPAQPYMQMSAPQYYGPAWSTHGNTVPMPAVSSNVSTIDVGAAPRIQHRCQLNDQEKQYLVGATPQPYPNVVGSWPAMMHRQQFSATESQKYCIVFMHDIFQ